MTYRIMLSTATKIKVRFFVKVSFQYESSRVLDMFYIFVHGPRRSPMQRLFRLVVCLLA